MPLPRTTTFPPREPPSIRRFYYVINMNVDGSRSVRGPYLGHHVSLKSAVQIQNFGEIVSANEYIRLPLECGVKPRSIIRDAATNMTWTCVDSNPWVTHVEAYVMRATGDQ